MNPDEQRERKGAHERLAKRVEALELLVAQLMMNDNILIGESHQHKGQIANIERRCDERAVTHDAQIDALMPVRG